MKFMGARSGLQLAHGTEQTKPLCIPTPSRRHVEPVLGYLLDSDRPGPMHRPSDTHCITIPWDHAREFPAISRACNLQSVHWYAYGCWYGCWYGGWYGCSQWHSAAECASTTLQQNKRACGFARTETARGTVRERISAACRSCLGPSYTHDVRLPSLTVRGKSGKRFVTPSSYRVAGPLDC